MQKIDKNKDITLSKNSINIESFQELYITEVINFDLDKSVEHISSILAYFKQPLEKTLESIIEVVKIDPEASFISRYTHNKEKAFSIFFVSQKDIRKKLEDISVDKVKVDGYIEFKDAYKKETNIKIFNYIKSKHAYVLEYDENAILAVIGDLEKILQDFLKFSFDKIIETQKEEKKNAEETYKMGHELLIKSTNKKTLKKNTQELTLFNSKVKDEDKKIKNIQELPLELSNKGFSALFSISELLDKIGIFDSDVTKKRSNENTTTYNLEISESDFYSLYGLSKKTKASFNTRGKKEAIEGLRELSNTQKFVYKKNKDEDIYYEGPLITHTLISHENKRTNKKTAKIELNIHPIFMFSYRGYVNVPKNIMYKLKNTIRGRQSEYLTTFLSYFLREAHKGNEKVELFEDQFQNIFSIEEKKQSIVTKKIKTTLDQIKSSGQIISSYEFEDTKKGPNLYNKYTIQLVTQKKLK